ncbi:catalase family protein [Lyngbya aestuarii]|uniref:catalase family protein n=1 Tax=Lyngbya aestuarii TaxID=118322 RepID=UPI00403DD8C6
MQNPLEKLELGKEHAVPGEEEAFQKITDIHIKSFLETEKKPVPRAQHPKHHGCVKAEFIVEDNLPENLRVGVFREPRSFPTWIRFSNSREQDDTKLDGRGMAVKLMEVDGEKLLDDEQKTQDFLMINYPLFFIGNIPDYVEFFSALQKSRFPLKFFFPSFNPVQWRLRELYILVATAVQKVVNPLLVQYWSTTPYKLGEQAIQFSARPTTTSQKIKPFFKSKNYLREAMVEYLKNQEACFDFMVQLQTDPVKMPIENPTIRWNSPYIKVATIKIPPQSFDSDEQMKFCENLAYTPWHSLPEHRPLGGINRGRLMVYQMLSKQRHDLNNAPLREPTP